MLAFFINLTDILSLKSIDVASNKNHYFFRGAICVKPAYFFVLKTWRDKPDTVSPLEVSFPTKFLAVYSFIKVKGPRPMTYQYLTVEMVDKAKTNGGFIDQKLFKTAGKYSFDSLFLTDTSMQVLEGYIKHIHPLLKPNCDYVLVTKNNKLGEAMSKFVFDATGKYVHPTRYRQIVETASCDYVLVTKNNKLGEAMSKFVFDATGKYVHPTRYRQIVETASSRTLSSSAQDAISEDQKHSSVVAKVH